MKKLLRSLAALLFLLPAPCLGEFTAHDVLVISNAAMKESVYLGRYYAKKRGIPEESIVELPLPATETITRDEFNNRLHFPLKKEFDKRPDLLSKRVYVLMYGVPLSIANNSIPEEASQMQTRLQQVRSENQKKLRDALTELQKIELSATGRTTPQLFMIDEPGPPGAILANIQKLIAFIASGNHENREGYLSTIRDIVVSLFSYQGKFSLTHPDKQKERAGYQSKMNEAYSLPNPRSSSSLDAYLAKVHEIFGVVGVLQRLPALSDELFGSETGASVDSELGIVWLLPGGAPLSGRIPNPLYMHTTPPKDPAFPFPVTGRLDGPNPGVVRRMIDSSIAVEEAQSLSGNFLIDAQGVPWDKRDEFGEWDRDLTLLARNAPSGKRFNN
jgi:hypothetical protein